jgi:uncharacterized membrane protein
VLELNPSGMLVIVSSALALSLYLLSIKKYPLNKFSLFFWTHLFTYGFFAGFILLHDFLLEQDHLQALRTFTTDITLTNVPFYCLEALISICSIMIMGRLMSACNMTVVVAFTQINLLFTTAGVVLLGNSTNVQSLIGILIISCGALIAGLKKDSYNIFKDHDLELFKLGTFSALLQAARIWITYLCTAKMNPTTHGILHTLNQHLQIIPFAPMTPMHFNAGVQLITAVALFVYVKYWLKEPESIVSGIKNHYTIIVVLSALYTLFIFLYLTSFGMIPNKHSIIGLHKIYVPITAYLGYKLYGTEPSRQTTVGIFIIMLGSIYMIVV